MPQRERYLFVCANRRADDDARGSCAARGSLEVQRALKEQLAASGLAKFQARVCASSCLDQCAIGITILVEPQRPQETNIINSAAEGLALVNAIGDPNFQLMVDFYHLARVKEDPSIIVRATDAGDTTSPPVSNWRRGAISPGRVSAMA